MINFKRYFYKSFLLFVIFLIGMFSPASSAFAIVEIEDNNTFETRQILPSGTTMVEGELATFEVKPLYTFHGDLTAGEIEYFDIVGGFSAGDPFYAWTDNVSSDSYVDTMLGLFTPEGSLIDYNDDGGPFGDDYGSGIDGTANDDGTIHMGVTGYDDSNFDGSHTESGEYSLYVVDYTMFGDNDFFSFTGLLPGSTLTAEIFSDEDEDFDTMLGWYGSDGSLIDYDDDGGEGYLSSMDVLVPESGTLNFLVTGYDYFDEGFHAYSGDYTLELTPTVVPEPISSTLFLIGGVALGFRRFRKRA